MAFERRVHALHSLGQKELTAAVCRLQLTPCKCAFNTGLQTVQQWLHSSFAQGTLQAV